MNRHNKECRRRRKQEEASHWMEEAGAPRSVPFTSPSLCSRCGPALGLELGGPYSDWPRGLSTGVHEKRCEWGTMAVGTVDSKKGEAHPAWGKGCEDSIRGGSSKGTTWAGLTIHEGSGVSDGKWAFRSWKQPKQRAKGAHILLLSTSPFMWVFIELSKKACSSRSYVLELFYSLCVQCPSLNPVFN